MVESVIYPGTPCCAKSMPDLMREGVLRGYESESSDVISDGEPETRIALHLLALLLICCPLLITNCEN